MIGPKMEKIRVRQNPQYARSKNRISQGRVGAKFEIGEDPL